MGKGSARPATRHLGRISNKATNTLDLVPWGGGGLVVTLQCSEFTSHCPVTGQPDFATLRIEYMPDKSIVETKSLKLYLWSYRDKAMFNEQIVEKIAADIIKQVRPKWVTVAGAFAQRGGISVQATATRDGR